MLQIIPFKEEHLNVFQLREPGLSFVKNEDLARYAKMYAQYPSFTLVCNNIVIGAVGVIILWEGFGEVWVCVGNEIEKHKKEFHRIVKSLLCDAIRNFNLRRVQASVNVNYEIGKKWAKRLGFEPEGIMRRFGPNGEDCILFARIIEG